MNQLRLLAFCLALAPSLALANAPAPVVSGRAVYESVCIACHAVENVMVAAPKLGDSKDWTQRLNRAAKGKETLIEHAIQGFGAMPPKGGAAVLSRTEALNAIEYMMAGPKPK